MVRPSTPAIYGLTDAQAFAADTSKPGFLAPPESQFTSHLETNRDSSSNLFMDVASVASSIGNIAEDFDDHMGKEDQPRGSNLVSNLV